MNSNANLFVFESGAQQGPFHLDQVLKLLSSGKVSGSAYYWKEGMADWQPIKGLLESRAQVAAAEVRAEKRTQPRVLVVDDDALVREIIMDLLAQENVSFETTDSLQGACDLLQKNGLSHFDAVVTDYEMIGGRGVDLVRWVKLRENALQVLLLTAKDDKEVVKLGLRSGALDFLEKPIRRKVFLPAVRSAVNQTLRQREEREAYMELIHMKLAKHNDESGAAVERLMTELVQRESNVGGLLAKLETIMKYSKEIGQELPAVSVPVAELPFQGQISDLSLLDLVQLFSQLGKTGEFQIQGRSGETKGNIYLKDGRICHAIQGALTGYPALFNLMGYRQGYFCFYYGRSVAEESIAGGTTAVLLQISSEMDEKERAVAA